VTAEDVGGLSLIEPFTIIVGDVNEAPTAVELDNLTVEEHVDGDVVGNVTVTDPDDGDTHTITVSDNRFEVVGGQLKLKDGETLDHETESTVSLDITAEDSSGSDLTENFVITVNDVNETPTDIAVDNLAVDENAEAAVVGNVTIADPDDGDTQAFTLSDNRFEVVGGQLRLKAGESLDHEAEPTVSLDITVEDSGGLEVTEPFVITVNDLNEAPTDIALDNTTVDEQAEGALIGNVTVTDQDDPDTHTFTVSDNRFEVVGGQLKLKAGQSLDAAVEPTVSIDITAEDAGGLELTESFVITVRPLAAGRVDVTLTESRTSELDDPIAGEVDSLPANLPWMDEWTSFYIEIWVSGDGFDVSAASLTLNYNTDYFTAVDSEVEWGPAFENAPGLIVAVDDATGTVQLEGSTTVADAGDDRPALMARVYFATSTDDPGVDLVADGGYVSPADDLGFAVDTPQLTLAGIGAREPEVGPGPDTELWPVMYDMDDDNKVHFSDLAFWAAEFPGFVGDPGADRAGIADFEHNGRVFFEDLSFYSPNFGKVKEDVEGRIYSPNFPSEWRIQPQRLAETSGSPSRQALDESAKPGFSSPPPVNAAPTENDDLVRVARTGGVRDAANQESKRRNSRDTFAVTAIEAGPLTSHVPTAVDPNSGEISYEALEPVADVGWFVERYEERRMKDEGKWSLPSSSDSLNVVTHELEHILGHDAHGLMGEVLQSGTRRLWDEAHESLESESDHTDQLQGLNASAIEALFGKVE
jgi:hypothetical protein